MRVKASCTLLLSLAHYIHYGLSFNTFNGKLDALQKKHFALVNGDILSIRDPFSVYKGADEVLLKLYNICGLADIDGVLDVFNDRERRIQYYDVDGEWLVEVMFEAVTRYKERNKFNMIEYQYHECLLKILGEDGFKGYLFDVKSLVGNGMICGNADQSGRVVKDFLVGYGAEYVVPPHPYMEKYDRRFAQMREEIRLAVAKYSA